MAKILLIGATGHIGGAVLDLVSSTYPDAQITALVRDEQKATQLTANYSNLRTVIGDLENVALLKIEAADADVVINTAPDVRHKKGIQTILDGLSSRPASLGKGYYVQTSGAALIWDAPDGSKPGAKIWDDVEDIDAILSFPDETIHRSADKLAFSKSDKINVAIISPVAVYGLSPSPIHPFPLTLPEIMNAIRSINSGFTISSGLNLQNYVHVMDLARLYLLLLSHALSALDPNSNTKSNEGGAAETEIWGPKAYYFGAGPELSFLNFMTAMASILKEKGVIESQGLQRIDIDQASRASGAKDNKGGIKSPNSWAVHVAVMFGVDMRVRSSRARKLGWVPREQGVVEGLGDVVGKWLEWEKKKQNGV